VHAGSPCDAVSWAPCDRSHRQPRSDAAAQQGIACSHNREEQETLALRRRRRAAHKP